MVILTTNCFTYIYVPKFLSLYRYILVAIFFLFLSIKNKNEIRDKLFEKNIIVIFLICPLLSIIPAMMFHNQSFSQSFIAVLNTLPGVLMYWILHKLNPKPKFVIGGLLLMAVVWSSIEAIQQFTYPNYVFGYRAVAEDVIKGTMLDQRNGIWQYKIQPWYIGMIAAFYSWQQLLTSKQNKKLFIFVFIIALCGIYLYMARVVIVSTICMLVYIFILICKSLIRLYPNRSLSFKLSFHTTSYFFILILFCRQMSNRRNLILIMFTCEVFSTNRNIEYPPVYVICNDSSIMYSPIQAVLLSLVYFWYPLI